MRGRFNQLRVEMLLTLEQTMLSRAKPQDSISRRLLATKTFGIATAIGRRPLHLKYSPPIHFD